MLVLGSPLLSSLTSNGALGRPRGEPRFPHLHAARSSPSIPGLLHRPKDTAGMKTVLQTANGKSAHEICLSFPPVFLCAVSPQQPRV